jgi:hypothetical protein
MPPTPTDPLSLTFTLTPASRRAAKRFAFYVRSSHGFPARAPPATAALFTTLTAWHANPARHTIHAAYPVLPADTHTPP